MASPRTKARQETVWKAIHPGCVAPAYRAEYVAKRRGYRLEVRQLRGTGKWIGTLHERYGTAHWREAARVECEERPVAMTWCEDAADVRAAEVARG